MPVITEVRYFAEEMELYSPEGNLVAPLADYMLTIEVHHNADWQLGDAHYPNGANVQAGKFGSALYEIIKLSIRRPENKRHVRAIQELVADAEYDHRNSRKSAAREYWWRTRYEGAV